jgi:hypothetical protein
MLVVVVRVGCAGCVCAAHPCCFVRLTRISAPKIGKPWHIGDCRKALDETYQTITFNLGLSVGSNKILMNLDYSWQYLPERNLLIMLDLVSVLKPWCCLNPGLW